MLIILLLRAQIGPLSGMHGQRQIGSGQATYAREWRRGPKAKPSGLLATCYPKGCSQLR